MHSPGQPLKKNSGPQKPAPEKDQEGRGLFLYFGEDFIPLHDLVLAECKFLEEVEGIIIPEEAHKKQLTAKCLKVGPGRMLENGDMRPPPCKPGDWIFTSGRGMPIKLGERALMLVNASDVLGVFPEGPHKPKNAKECLTEMNMRVCHCGNPDNPDMIHRTDMACFPKAKEPAAP